MKKLILLSVLSVFCGFTILAKSGKKNIKDTKRYEMFKKLEDNQWHELKIATYPKKEYEKWVDVQYKKIVPGPEGIAYLDFRTFWRDKIEAVQEILTRNTEYGNAGDKQYKLNYYKIECNGMFRDYHLYAEILDDFPKYGNTFNQMAVDLDMMELK